MIAKGVLHFGGAVVVGRLLQLSAFLALAHELTPAKMGMVALLSAVFIGLHSLTNFGFDRYIVYAESKHIANVSHLIDVIWTLQLIRGAGIFFLSVLLAFFISSFSSLEIEIEYFLGIGLALLIYNCMNPYVVIHEREGDFNYVARISNVSAIASGLSVVLLVFVWQDPWVYVIGQIISTVCYTLMTFRCSDVLPRISFDKQVAINVFGYCKHLLLMAMVSFAAVQFENFYIALMFGPVVLGIYFTWARIVQLPREVVTQFTERILFSRACNQMRAGSDFSRLHLVSLAVSMMTVVPFYVFMWNHGNWLVGMVAGPEWVEYWWAGKFFIIINLLFMLSSTIGPFTLSCFPQLASRLRTVESFALMLLIAWLGQAYGIEGVLAAGLISIMFATFFRIYILYGKIITEGRFRHLLFSICIAGAILLPLLTGEYILASGDAGMKLNGALLAFYCLCYTVVGFVMLYFRKRAFD